MIAPVPVVFIHSAPRTSSTWFWTRFRELPSTRCFYEPFNDKLVWLTPDRASTLAHDSWESRHAPTDPYYREYTPLILKTGGVECFEPAMAYEWFIPQGGLRGELRPSEKAYLSLLIRHADQAGKIPVFGGWRSLGRIWAIKQAFGGVNIFQYRNLWQQWLSFLSYKRRGSLTFYVNVVDTIFRDDDPYFAYLVECGLRHAADPRTGKDPTASPLTWTRSYPTMPRDETKVRQLELLPEHQAFSLFMGMHIYLYLHAQLSADLTADVTRMASDAAYRSDIERGVERLSGLAVSFADAAKIERPNGVDFDVGAIDWNEIREHARVAVQMLGQLADPAELMKNAAAFIDTTVDEMRESRALPAARDARPRPDGQSASAEGGKTIGLCMIVKNESKVIRRCLTSALPLVDYILIVDTGSTDGTQQIIRDFLAENNIRGAVIDEPWRDFAYNRSFALERLREVEDVDYAMIIDADDSVVFDDGFDPRAFKAQMNHDLYDVQVIHGNIKHFRPQICSNRLPFSFKGVLHEYLEAPAGELSRATANGVGIKIGHGSARSENPRKFQDDAALLERALGTETDPFLISRYTFYLAQSYRDCGEHEKALANYLKRAELGYWSEEIYVSLLEAGNMMAALKWPFEEVIAAYERATQTVPGRAEAQHAASLYCRNQGRNAEGMEFARRGIELTQPGGLFVQPWVYDYGILDEFAINAYWAGAYRESLDASLKLLAGNGLPASMVKRVAANARFAADKLPKHTPPNLGTFGAESLTEQHVGDKAPAAALLATVGDGERNPQASSREDERAGPVVDAKLTFASCPVCGATETTKPRRDLEPHPYFSCSQCGLFYQPHMPAKVFEGHHEIRGDLMSEADRQANRQLAGAFYRNHLATKYKGQELFHLDIGSKYPFFGHCLQAIARQSGTPLTSHGIDGIPEAREFGRQLGVLMAVGDFEADPQTWDMSPEMRERVALGRFHCVSLIHCLEHFYNPLRTLRNIRRLMVEGGILFVRSPDSQAPGIERDFTPGHYTIHPTIWREEAMYEVLAKLQDAFVVYETYEIAHQRDYLLQAVDRKPTIGVGLVVQNHEKSVGSVIESVSAVADRFCVRHAGLPDSLVKSLEELVGDRLDIGPCPETQSQTDESRQAARNRYVEALDHDTDWVLRLDAEETVPSDTRDIIRRAPYMPFDVHDFQIRIGTDAYRQSRLWRTKRGVRYIGASEENPVFPADFKVRHWNREIVPSGVSRSAAILERYRTLRSEAERPEAGGLRLFQFVNACRDAYGVTNEKHYLEEAISAFEKCLDSDPSHARDSYRSTAACYADLGHDWEAATAARKALEYAPHDEAFRTWMRERTPSVINILRPGAIGDVLASSAVTAQLAVRNPDIEIHYYTKVPAMAKLLVGVHKVCDADEWAKRERGADFSLVGYPIGEGYPERPMRKHLTEYFCDEVRLPRGVPRLKEELEPFDIGGRWITIHPKSGWSVYKDWGLDKWNEIVRRIHRGYPDIAIVQIGGADDPTLEGADRDLRGRTSLPQSLWLLKHSALHLGCDSFSNHAAGAFGHPAVIIFGSTSPTGSGYESAVNLWAGLNCSPCYREDPRISRQSRGPCINPPGQEYERPRHACTAAIGVEEVWAAITRLISAGTSVRFAAVGLATSH